MSGEEPHATPEARLLGVMMEQMRMMLRQELEEVHERLDHVEHNNGNGNERRNPEPRPLRIEPQQQLKVNIPIFKGTVDPEAYLDWEIKIEHAFSCNQYTDDQKVKLAVAEFSDYALVWWDRLQKERLRYEEPLVDTWAELKRIMRKRYVATSYHRDVMLQLQRMKQGQKSVEEYYKDMEVTLIRGKVNEEEEVTMARFLNCLNSEIRDKVELLPYISMEELLHKAIQVEQQTKRKSTERRHSPTKSHNKVRWQEQAQREIEASKSSSSNSRPHGKTPINSNPSETNVKVRAREMKCFKCNGRGHYAYECPSKRVMVLKDNGEYTSESENEGGGGRK